MKRVHIIGGKNHGKTKLIEELIQHFTSHGLRVASIKHTHHHHELDAPGKDSHRHREAGACLVGVLSRQMSAVFIPLELAKQVNQDPAALPDEDRYLPFEPLFSLCDLVLVEGDTGTAAPKVEVWRAAMGTPPRSVGDQSVRAIISDDDAGAVCSGVPYWSRSDIGQLAQNVLDLVSQSTG